MPNGDRGGVEARGWVQSFGTGDHGVPKGNEPGGAEVHQAEEAGAKNGREVSVIC